MEESEKKSLRDLRNNLITEGGRTIHSLMQIQIDIRKSRENIENGIISTDEILLMYTKFHGIVGILIEIEVENIKTAKGQ